MKIYRIFFAMFFLFALSACDELEPTEVYTVQFNTNAETTIDAVEVEENRTIQEPSTITYEGYEFQGWYSDSTMNVPYDFSSPILGDLTLYAKWSPVTVTVSFVTDGDEAIDDVVLTYGETVTLPEVTVPTGYQLSSWYTDSDYTTLFDSSDVITEDMTLYATFEQVVYSITIYENGVAEYTFNFHYEDDISNIIEMEFDEDPDTFAFLYTDMELEDLFNLTAMPAEDITLYLDFEIMGPLPAEGRIDILTWAGDDVYYSNLGQLNLTGELNQVVASYYVAAKEYNEIYPNVQINLLALSGGPNDYGRDWAMELDIYASEFGFHPSIWTTVDLAGDVAMGKVADLTRFSNDPLYQAMNPAILDMMNYYGFQAGLPSYILPWGVYVNYDLADDYNLDVPNYDWTIEEYTDFTSNKLDDVYYGAVGTPISFIETGTTTIMKSLAEYPVNDYYVDLNSAEVRDLVPYINEWSSSTVWNGGASNSFFDANGYWSYSFFANGAVLTNDSDPWMMGECAYSTWMSCGNNWDIYPRPSTPYVDNTIGIVLDPMAIYNSCLDDGDLSCSMEEEARISLAYSFASFMIADSRVWEAKAEFPNAMNDSFPVTTGTLYEEQMAYWYSTQKHQRFADSTLMPGFQEVLRIYESGAFWDVSDKSFPWFTRVDGQRVTNLLEWRNYWDPGFTNGVTLGSPGYTDTVLTLLPEWNTNANTRFAQSFTDLENALMIYYGYQQEDFE